MRMRSIVLGLLLGLALSASSFAQSTFATVSGTVADPTGAVLLDTNISKAIGSASLKMLQFRVDASDVLNHPEPNAPSLNITGTNASNFGLILGKTNLHRMLQAQLRFTF